MPMFVGEWIPRNNIKEEHECYRASMLALLKPWNTMGDLKTLEQTFQDAFSKFIATADEWVKNIIQNIQYQHECSDSAAKKRSNERDRDAIVKLFKHEGMSVVDGYTERDEDDSVENVLFMQNNIEHKLTSEFSLDDQLYAEATLNIAIDHDIFNRETVECTSWDKLATPATHEQMAEYQNLVEWAIAVHGMYESGQV
jgi:hypothetical protein